MSIRKIIYTAMALITMGFTACTQMKIWLQR